MFCDNCSNYNKDDANFCWHCGKKIEPQSKPKNKSKWRLVISEGEKSCLLLSIAVFCLLFITHYLISINFQLGDNQVSSEDNSPGRLLEKAKYVMNFNNYDDAEKFLSSINSSAPEYEEAQKLLKEIEPGRQNARLYSEFNKLFNCGDYENALVIVNKLDLKSKEFDFCQKMINDIPKSTYEIELRRVLEAATIELSNSNYNFDAWNFVKMANINTRINYNRLKKSADVTISINIPYLFYKEISSDQKSLLRSSFKEHYIKLVANKGYRNIECDVITSSF